MSYVKKNDTGVIERPGPIDFSIEEVEQRLGVRIEHRGQGRPRKPRIGGENHV